MRRCRVLCTMALLVACLSASAPAGRMAPKAFQALGAVPRGTAQAVPLGPLPASDRLQVSLGLPLRNPEGLAELRRQLHDPASPLYHQWLTTERFTEAFGPAAEDYAKVAAWAQGKGLTVTQTAPNRLVLNVSGLTPDIENAFGVRMLQYRHASGVVFRSPDRIPTLDLDVPVDTVSGLNDLLRPVKRLGRGRPVPEAGSGSGGSYLGGDLRKAYAVGVPSAIKGAGQGIALLEFTEYYPAAVAKYWLDAGMTAPTIVDVKVAGGATDFTGQDEAAADIEIAGAMAPAATLYVYMGQNATTMLNRIVTDGLCKAVSVSWGWISDNQTSQTSIDATQDAVFQAMDAQGIACFVASGDSGKWTAAQWNDPLSDANLNPVNPADVPYITSVGGTQLTTSVAGAWTGETVWNNSTGSSSGGPSERYTMPSFQAFGINWASISGASTTMRNCPDVTANAVNYYVEQGSPTKAEFFDGTSLSTPLWAGFFALMNETAVAQGLTSLGNLNTILYQVGTGSSYAATFHDVTSGNDGFGAGTGFDMASGWGSMVGQTTIDALLGEIKPHPPSIGTEPQGASIVVGQTATFTVGASGTPPLSYQWSRSGTAITGATSFTYTTPPAALADDGVSFTVKVTNGLGSVTSNAAVLMVTAAPVAPAITAQPQSATVLTGQSATFTVTASGTMPLSYQWSKNGQPIAGATSAACAVTAGNVANAVGDSYTVVVSNSAGTATSDPALLYVTAMTLDFNADGAVDVLDLAALAAAYGANVAAVELDGGATVDDQDIVIWFAGFGGNP